MLTEALPCRDGCLKIFQKPLDAKKVLKNRSKGIDLRSALTATSNSEVRGNKRLRSPLPPYTRCLNIVTSVQCYILPWYAWQASVRS